LFEFLVFIL